MVPGVERARKNLFIGGEPGGTRIWGGEVCSLAVMGKPTERVEKRVGGRICRRSRERTTEIWAGGKNRACERTKKHRGAMTKRCN